jgi:hypothetical protein
VHGCLVAGLELECHGKGDVSPVVERAGVVTELHVLPVDRAPVAFFHQQLGGFENFGDEHGAFPFWGRRQKMEVLPHCSAHRARDSHVMLEARPFPLNGLGYQLAHHRAALHPQLPVVGKPEMARGVAYDQAAKTLVTDEDVGAQSEHEIIDSKLTGGRHSPCQIVRRCCIVEEIGGTTNPERGVLSKRLVALEPSAA